MSRKRLLKALGLSMLVAVGAMAVNASAAQAKWVIKENGNSVSEITFVYSTFNLSELLVPGLLAFHCTGGAGSGTLAVQESGKKLTLSNSFTFLIGCLVKGSNGTRNSFCTVNSPGASNGMIVVTGSGEGKMESTKTFILKNAKAEIEVSGILCPLDEMDEELNGSEFLTIDNPSTSSTLHSVLLDDDKLKYGANNALLHDGVSAANPISVSAELNSGQSWAIELTGL